MGMSLEKARQILSLIDLTSLKGDESPEDIENLCLSAKNEFGCVAAICVYPKFVLRVKQSLTELSAEGIKIATVVNFPTGLESIEQVVTQTRWSIAQGADEVDVVLPYQQFLSGDFEHCEKMLSACREACGNTIAMKVIIESGELEEPQLIRKASELAIQCGADFVKTSTGKVPINATPEAAECMLKAIRDSGKVDIGFKASGGIRQPEDAARYLTIAEAFFGPEWITPAHFRFGVSGLLDNLIAELKGEQSKAVSGY